MPVENGLTPRLRRPTKAAAISPNTAPDAPPDSEFGDSDEGAGRTGEQGGEVQQAEADAPDRRLQQVAELEQQQHVEGEVDDAEVEEARRHEPVPLAVVGEERLGEAEVELAHRRLASELMNADVSWITSQMNTATLRAMIE